MALPALVLAPIAAFLGGIASKLLDGVITLFTKKFLINAALIDVFITIYGEFMTGLNLLLSILDVFNLLRYFFIVYNKHIYLSFLQNNCFYFNFYNITVFYLISCIVTQPIL